MATNLTDLNTLREIHVRARARARSAWGLCVDLNACRVWLPVAATRTRLAEAIYYNAGYDASERYATVDEFADELGSDLTEAWVVKEVRAGVDCYVARPFFGGPGSGDGYFGHLGLYGLAPLSLDDLKGLRMETSGFGASLVSGLSSEEAEVLMGFHRRGTLTAVNLLRKLETATHYFTRAVASKAYLALDADPAAAALVCRLAETARLPAFGAAASFFGTDADKANVLREFRLDAALAAFDVSRDALA